MLRILQTSAIVVITVAVSTAASVGEVFFDNFNRPDTNGLGNGWLSLSGDHDVLGIRNDEVSALVANQDDSEAGVCRPFDFSTPVTVTATFKEKSQFGGLLRGYGQHIMIRNDGVRDHGYGITFYRADQNYNNSSIFLNDGTQQLAIVPTTFQFGPQLQATTTFYPNGSITGRVWQGQDSFDFTFPARTIQSTGSNFAYATEYPDARGPTPYVYPRMDDLTLASGPAAPTAYTPPQSIAPLSRLGKWNGTTFEPVSPGEITNGNVHVLVHGWAPDFKAAVDSNKSLHNGIGLLAWDPQAVDSSGAAYATWMKTMAQTIETEDPSSTVLGYSWIDESATLFTSLSHPKQASISEAHADENGRELGVALRQVLASTYSGKIQLLGHSHGSKVATVAADRLENLNKPVPVDQLTIWDSPESGASFAGGEDFISGGANGLQTVLQSYATKHGIGRSTGETFVDNYYAQFGKAFNVSGLVNVQLLPAHIPGIGPDAQSARHGYPIDWYQRASSQFSNLGLGWNLGPRPAEDSYTQDWLSSGALPYDSSREFVLKSESGQTITPTPHTSPLQFTVYASSGNATQSSGTVRLTEHSPALLYTMFESASDDVAITFDYEFLAAGDGDQLGLWIDDDPRFFDTGLLDDAGIHSSSMDISDLIPGVHALTFALHSYGAANADVAISNIQIEVVPEPSFAALPLVVLCAACRGCGQPRRRACYTKVYV